VHVNEERVCVCERERERFAANLVEILPIHFWALNQACREDGERVSTTKKVQINFSRNKVMFVVFFDWKGIVHHEFVPHGQMVNKQLYQEF
jgi:hypothetical protein